MQILVIAATNHEIASFIADNKEVDILVTGIGCTSYHLPIAKKIIQ
jgi:hypothetical protein